MNIQKYKILFWILIALLFFALGYQLNSFQLKGINQTRKDIWDKKLQSNTFGNFTGGSNNELAIIYSDFSNGWENQQTEIKVFSLEGMLVAHMPLLNIEGSQNKIYAIRPDKTKMQDYLTVYGGSGAHGWNLKVFMVEENHINFVNCPDKGSFSFGGDGGMPDFNQIVNDIDDDGILEIVSIDRDMERNLRNNNDRTYYTVSTIARWNGYCFLKVKREDYSRLFDMYLRKHPDQAETLTKSPQLALSPGDEEPDICRQKGGKWLPMIGFGKNPNPCQFPAIDKDKSCTSGNQCRSGSCINPYQRKSFSGGPPEWIGKCSEFLFVSGCERFLNNGIVQDVCY